MGAIITLAIKDLKLLVRDRIALFWSIAFPLSFALFFGSVFGGDGDGGSKGKMAIVVVDEAQSTSSSAFVERLGASDSVELDTAVSVTEAETLVRKGQRVAYLRVTKEFSDGAFALFGGGGDDSDATLELGVDPARTAERGMLVGVITQNLFSGLGQQFTDPAKMNAQVQVARAGLAKATGMKEEQKAAVEGLFSALGDFSEQADSSELTQPLELGANLVVTKEVGRDDTGQPRSPFQITFPSAIVWGLIGVTTTFAASLVRERNEGTLLRLRVAPLSHGQVLAGKGLACFLAGLGVSALLLAIGVVALGVDVGQPLLLLLALPCAAACFTGIMMVLSVSGKTVEAVAGTSWAIIMPLAMLGGGMIPLIAMPSWMLTASHASPFKWAILAIEGAVWRDLSLGDLALPIAILLGVAIGLYTLGVSLFRRQL